VAVAVAVRLRSETLTKPLAGQTVVLVVTVSLPQSRVPLLLGQAVVAVL